MATTPSERDDFEDLDDFDFEERVTGAEQEKPGEEVNVTIEHRQWQGESCAELYAEGEAFNDEMEKVRAGESLPRSKIQYDDWPTSSRPFLDSRSAAWAFAGSID